MTLGRKSINRTGEVNYNKFGSKMIISKYYNNRNVDIHFPKYNWTIKHRYYCEFQKGQIKCPYETRYLGVGYIGEGQYKTVDSQGKHSKCFTTWYNMLMRCYNTENIHERNYVYGQCYVCDEWLNYQNFAKWYYDNIYYVGDEQMCLDKDILFKNNKEYSDYYCIFVPQSINKLFTKTDKLRGEYPIGVYYYKNTNKFKAQYNNGRKHRVSLGYFNTVEEAFEEYKRYKEQYIKSVADEYKTYIPRELYKAMYEYEVEIDD